ncbi:MAG TPA: hypothetical protein PK403_01950, partial [Plasticicumulans sp.]|nr:hypothetical protein [Plasticicumulans sp.]
SRIKEVRTGSCGIEGAHNLLCHISRLTDPRHTHTPIVLAATPQDLRGFAERTIQSIGDRVQRLGFLAQDLLSPLQLDGFGSVVGIFFVAGILLMAYNLVMTALDARRERSKLEAKLAAKLART